MLFSLRELVQWLGFATFEIFLHGLALLAFSVLLVLKVDGAAPALSCLKFVFEMLLCQKLVERTRELWYGLIMSPVFILLQLLMIRACRVN
ncbi:TM203 protein, partial [Dryoscopus gambensis]|nr:TM203 protein [Dryoscopus gambensis]